MPYDILNIKEAADFLRVPASTIYKLVHDGRIPGVKVGKQWRFLKKDLQHLFDQKAKKHSQIPEDKE